MLPNNSKAMLVDKGIVQEWIFKHRHGEKLCG